MIGLGVGIDYALFIVTRHFRGLNDGLDLRESIARAVATSGGAVAFAGGTVTIALVSLAVAGIPLVTTMGLMAAIAVVVAVLAALTLLPAHARDHRPAHQLAAGPRPPSRPRCTRRSRSKGLWARWAEGVARHPVIAMARGPGDLDPAGGPAAVAEPGAKGRRRAVHLDHRAPGLRPDLAELRARGERAADHRGVARLARASPSGSSAARPVRSGSDPRSHRPAAADTAEGRLDRPTGVAAVTPGADRQGRDHRLLQRDRHHRPGRPGHRRPGQHAALQRDPGRREGHEHDGLRGRHHRRLCGSGLGHLQQAPAADPGRDRAQLPAADCSRSARW